MIGIPGSGDALWLAVGWTMLHVMWVGCAIGAVAAVAARATRSVNPETRYVIALAFLAVLGVSPMVIFGQIYEPPLPVSQPILVGNSAIEKTSSITHEPAIEAAQAPRLLAAGGFVREPSRNRFQPVVALLPWFWMAGSCLTLLSLAAGLIGVERLRRSSRRIAGSAIEERCRMLAASLKIARRVSVGVCDRLAGPILIGVIRPLILLPSAALTGWTPNELEMVLLHELAHVRRWDNLVNIVQRLIEALMFFHPAAWWLSAWVRLERELACDRLVVGRLGDPIAYADMLFLMATSRGSVRGVASALADRQAATRIRLLLNPGDRSMKLTMPEGLGLVGALVVAAFMAFGSRASDPPADAKDREIGQALAQAAADLAALPLDPSNRMSKPMTLIDVASAQLAVGEKNAAQETLRKAGESLDLTHQTLEMLDPLMHLAQDQRKAGDVAGAGSTLHRMYKYVTSISGKAIVDAVNKEGAQGDPKEGHQPGSMGEDDPSIAMIRCEILFVVANEWLELGDRVQAVAIARDSLKVFKADAATPGVVRPGGSDPRVIAASIKDQTNSMRVMGLGLMGMIQFKAGDTDWRESFVKARRLAGLLRTPAEKAETLSSLARCLTEIGEIDQALELATTLTPAARPAALKTIIEALTNDHATGAWLDPASIKITIGADSFTLKHRENALQVLPRIAQAVRAGVGSLHQARLLSMVAHLQAKEGDFAAARETALSIPAIKRADFPGLADGFYDAIKPVTLGLIAETRARVGSKRRFPGRSEGAAVSSRRACSCRVDARAKGRRLDRQCSSRQRPRTRSGEHADRRGEHPRPRPQRASSVSGSDDGGRAPGRCGRSRGCDRDRPGDSRLSRARKRPGSRPDRRRMGQARRPGRRASIPSQGARPPREWSAPRRQGPDGSGTPDDIVLGPFVRRFRVGVGCRDERIPQNHGRDVHSCQAGRSSRGDGVRAQASRWPARQHPDESGRPDGARRQADRSPQAREVARNARPTTDGDRAGGVRDPGQPIGSQIIRPASAARHNGRSGIS